MKKLVLAAFVALALATAATGSAATRGDGRVDRASITLAVYGDSPYGAVNLDTAQMKATPAFIDTINADPDVGLVLHVGDTHSGSDHCYGGYAADPWVNSDTAVFGLWKAFDDPLVYTPGDNEWTDCSKSKEGGWVSAAKPGDGYALAGHLAGDPLDNLALVRSIFFANPGWTLGAKMRVQSQATVGAKAERAFPENVTFNRANVQFVTLNVTGSNNDTLPWWKNAPNPDPAHPFAALSQRQADEVQQRTSADLAWLDRAFQEATESNAAGVVVGQQADMWDPAQVANGEGIDQYDVFVSHLAALAKAFGKPVLLINGDSHEFEVDNPLSSTDPLYSEHPVGYDVPNFTRITVHGKSAPMEWVKLTVDPSAPGVFSWTRVITNLP